MKETGYTIYDGISPITGDEIIAVITLNSDNIKTGDMPSMWILNKNVKPNDAVKTGADKAICGMCPHRHHLGGSCYVIPWQAPLNVWKTYHRGKYPFVTDLSIFKGMKIRFGAYGDPYVVPMDILAQLKAFSKNHTSYSHQWKQGDQTLKETSMASVDNIHEAIEAHKQGWRTFRVTHDINKLLDNEMICPNYTHKIQCIDCGLCRGAGKAKSIAIPVHGSKKNKFVEN
jgi:hypothetical protein